MSEPIAHDRPFKLGHRPQFDGLRGIAIILVLFHHAGIPQLHGGHIGVDIFFVLSGFLITVLIYQEYAEFDTVNLKRFYLRRVLRLMPALIGLLIAFGVVALATKSGNALVQTFNGILITAAYLSDVALALGYSDLGALEHTWSLAIEEHFYLLFPLSFLYLLRNSRSTTRLPVYIMSALIVVIAIHRILLWGPSPESVSRVFYGFDTRADGLLIGCLLGVITGAGKLPRVHRNLAIAASSILVLSAIFVSWDSRLYAYGLPIINISTAVVLAFVIKTGVEFLTNRVLAWIGVISYGLYLWHNLIFIIIRDRVSDSPWTILILGSVASVLTAAMSYYLLEKPFLRLKKRFAPSMPVTLKNEDDVLSARPVNLSPLA